MESCKWKKEHKVQLRHSSLRSLGAEGGRPAARVVAVPHDHRNQITELRSPAACLPPCVSGRPSMLQPEAAPPRLGRGRGAGGAQPAVGGSMAGGGSCCSACTVTQSGESSHTSAMCFASLVPSCHVTDTMFQTHGLAPEARHTWNERGTHTFFLAEWKFESEPWEARQKTCIGSQTPLPSTCHKESQLRLEVKGCVSLSLRTRNRWFSLFTGHNLWVPHSVSAQDQGTGTVILA